MNTNEMLDAVNHANEKFTFTVSLFNFVTTLLLDLKCFISLQVTGDMTGYPRCLCLALVCCQSSHKPPGTPFFRVYIPLHKSKLNKI